MRKIFQIYKDVLVVYLVSLWGISNIITFLVWGDDALMLSNAAFIMLFCLLIIAMRLFPNFNKWLNRDFWEEKK
jgi:hypothetical protein